MSTKKLQFQLGQIECIKPDYACIRPLEIEIEIEPAPMKVATDPDKLDIMQAEAAAADEVESFQDTDPLTVVPHDLHWPSFNGGQLRLLPLHHQEALRLMDELMVGELVLYLPRYLGHVQVCPVWLPQQLMVKAKSLMDECERIARSEAEQRRLNGLMFDIEAEAHGLTFGIAEADVR